jgi:hypothetical protein
MEKVLVENLPGNIMEGPEGVLNEGSYVAVALAVGKMQGDERRIPGQGTAGDQFTGDHDAGEGATELIQEIMEDKLAGFNGELLSHLVMERNVSAIHNMLIAFINQQLFGED